MRMQDGHAGKAGMASKRHRKRCLRRTSVGTGGLERSGQFAHRDSDLDSAPTTAALVGVRYPHDMLAGGVIGVAIGLATIRFLPRLAVSRRRSRPAPRAG